MKSRYKEKKKENNKQKEKKHYDKFEVRKIKYEKKQM